MHVVPDFVKAGIVVNGIEEPALREHLVLHSARLVSNEKPKQEVCQQPYGIGKGKE